MIRARACAEIYPVEVALAADVRWIGCTGWTGGKAIVSKSTCSAYASMDSNEPGNHGHIRGGEVSFSLRSPLLLPTFLGHTPTVAACLEARQLRREDSHFQMARSAWLEVLNVQTQVAGKELR